MDFFSQFNCDTRHHRALAKEMVSVSSSLRIKKLNDLFSASEKLMTSEGEKLSVCTGVIIAIKQRKGGKERCATLL